MRTLLLFRGAPGCGKSTFIKENNLEQFTLCADSFRMLYSSPSLYVNGEVHIPQEVNKIAWDSLFTALEVRMENGEFTVIDATNSKTAEMNKYKKLADEYRYRIYIVDMTDIPIEEVKRRNKLRPQWKWVPEEAIDNMYSRFATQKIPSGIKPIKPEEVKSLLAWRPTPLDSKYKEVVHIGDIHGCYETLMKALPNGIEEDKFYVFLGDYIERGPESAKVLDYIESIIDLPNVACLEGNHETHLWTYATGKTPRSKYFNAFTLPHLMANGWNEKRMRMFVRNLLQCFYYEFNGKKVLCTHGGISNPNFDTLFPLGLTCISTWNLIHGIGTYNDTAECDKNFSKGNEEREKIKEIWKPIKGYEGEYEISNYGRIKSLSRSITRKDGKTQHFKERILSQSLSCKGYPKVALHKKCAFIHRIVAETFIPNPNNLPQVNHLDENKLNNSVFNLEWTTIKENANRGTRNLRMANGHKKVVDLINEDTGEIKSFENMENASKYLGISLNTFKTYNRCRGYTIIKYKKDIDKTYPYKTIKPAECYINIPDAAPIYQVHAHRNIEDVEFEWVANLEGGVEFGKQLRLAILNEEGLRIEKVDYCDEVIENGESFGVKQDITVKQFVEGLRSNKHINEKQLGGNISSFNFTRGAFNKHHWDKETIKARGLFINTYTYRIVARAYNKFFNIDEQKSTMLFSIGKNAVFPIVGYKKYNGYLGIIGYDEEKDELVFTSKSEMGGPHALWLKEIIEEKGIDLELIKRYVKDNDCSLVFEVIDPINDPHIIKYDNRDVILLDSIKNTMNFNKIPYDELLIIGEQLGFKVKEKLVEVKDMVELREVLDELENPTSEYNTGVPIEGMVFEDQEGFMFKQKGHFYQQWKKLRALIKVVARGQNFVHTGMLINPEMNEFYGWLKLQKLSGEENIIELRDLFYRNKKLGLITSVK